MHLGSTDTLTLHDPPAGTTKQYVALPPARLDRLQVLAFGSGD